jgi:hypothetical protein
MGMTPIYGNPDPALAIATIHRAATPSWSWCRACKNWRTP